MAPTGLKILTTGTGVEVRVTVIEFAVGDCWWSARQPRRAAGLIGTGGRFPLWIGGSSGAALQRTARLADGWDGSNATPAQVAPIAQRLRAQRPGAGFTISVRTHWKGKDVGELRVRVVPAYAAAGVQHVLVARANREVGD